MKKLVNLFTVGTMFLAVTTALSSCKKDEILQPKTAKAAAVKTPEAPVGNQALHGYLNEEGFPVNTLFDLYRFRTILEAKAPMQGSIHLIQFGDSVNSTPISWEQLRRRAGPKAEKVSEDHFKYFFINMVNQDSMSIEIFNEKPAETRSFGLFRSVLHMKHNNQWGNYNAYALLTPNGAISAGCTTADGVFHPNENAGGQIYIMQIYYNINNVVDPSSAFNGW